MGSISDYIGQHVNQPWFDPAQRHNGDGTHETPTHSLRRNRTEAGKTPRSEDGQKYSTRFYSPGPDSGFKTSISAAGRVHNEGGGQQAEKVYGVSTSRMTQNSYGAGPTPGIVTGDDRGVR